MQDITINGIVRSLRHLQEFIIVLPGKAKDGADLSIAVSFGLHTVSKSCEAGQRNMLDENGKPRLFDQDRYSFSLQLPELATRMIEDNYLCWESFDRNRAMHYAVIDVRPEHIRSVKDGEHKIVFFYLHPGGNRADVRLVITSCHSRNIAFSNIKRRYNVHMLLRTCLYKGKRIP